jgi:hypothetical protein
MNKLVVCVALFLAACSGSGFGDAARKDIVATVGKAQDPLAACYKTRLAANRKLKGTIHVHVVAEAKTGKFTQVKIKHDEIGDPDLADCVVTELEKLALAEPARSNVEFDYPLAFSPTN